MSSLYRCRARVLYKPFNSNKAIIFDERQIAQLSVKLSWQPNAGLYNAQGASSLPISATALTNSTCQVTLTDPYLTGIAWPVLYDAASVYTSAYTGAVAGILMRPCGKGEDPKKSDCYPYVDIDKSTVADQAVSGEYAHILISLWYEVAGTKFGADYYFRVTSMSVRHGSSYPSVTIGGIDPRALVFNQTIASFKFEKNSTVNDNLRQIAKEAGYQINFCKAALEKGYAIPRMIIERGSTLQEAFMRNLNAVGGNMLSQPFREHANEFSVCTRADVQQPCTVFYLGKGLYEGYEIHGNTNANFATNNRQFPGSFSSGSNYTTEAFRANEYTISDITPNKRQAKMDGVKLKPTFPQQFNSVKNRSTFKGEQTGGWIWRGAGPKITPEEVQKTNLYGVSPNGTKAVSYLSGVITDASKSVGTVLIETDFFIQACSKVGSNNTDKCFSRPILQETRNLSTVSVSTQERVDAGKEIGTSTKDKQEYTRFAFKGYNGEVITIAPELVWKYAVSKEALTDKEKSDFGIKNGQGVVSTSSAESASVIPTSGGVFVGKVGTTGHSSGPHLHVQDETPGNSLSEKELIDLIGKIIFVGGKPSTSWQYVRGYVKHEYPALDYSGGDIDGKDIVVFGSNFVAKPNNGDCGNGVQFKTSGGRVLKICHMQNKSIPPNLAGQASVGGQSPYSPNVQGGPTTQGLEVTTEFTGIPRALRIVPGRTILSFVTDYDQWIEQGRPNTADPGIWIPERFRSWFVKDINLNWAGNLRVNISAVSDWGSTPIKVPRFDKYLEDLRKYEGATKTNDYYGYIRSMGTLCYRVGEKDSCETICEEAQRIQAFISQGQGSPGFGSGSISASPVGKCTYTGSKYPADRVNKILSAAYAAGIKTNVGLAAVVGNALVESKDNGIDLNPQALNEAGGDFGIFQWTGIRQEALKGYAQSNGADYRNMDTQMAFFRLELTGKSVSPSSNRTYSDYVPTVAAVNSARNIEQATAAFADQYEKPANKTSYPIRTDYAKEILAGMTCSG